MPGNGIRLHAAVNCGSIGTDSEDLDRLIASQLQARGLGDFQVSVKAHDGSGRASTYLWAMAFTPFNKPVLGCKRETKKNGKRDHVATGREAAVEEGSSSATGVAVPPGFVWMTSCTLEGLNENAFQTELGDVPMLLPCCNECSKYDAERHERMGHRAWDFINRHRHNAAWSRLPDQPSRSFRSAVEQQQKQYAAPLRCVMAIAVQAVAQHLIEHRQELQVPEGLVKLAQAATRSDGVVQRIARTGPFDAVAAATVTTAPGSDSSHTAAGTAGVVQTETDTQPAAGDAPAATTAATVRLAVVKLEDDVQQQSILTPPSSTLHAAQSAPPSVEVDLHADGSGNGFRPRNRLRTRSAPLVPSAVAAAAAAVEAGPHASAGGNSNISSRTRARSAQTTVAFTSAIATRQSCSAGADGSNGKRCRKVRVSLSKAAAVSPTAPAAAAAAATHKCVCCPSASLEAFVQEVQQRMDAMPALQADRLGQVAETCLDKWQLQQQQAAEDSAHDSAQPRGGLTRLLLEYGLMPVDEYLECRQLCGNGILAGVLKTVRPDSQAGSAGKVDAQLQQQQQRQDPVLLECMQCGVQLSSFDAAEVHFYDKQPSGRASELFAVIGTNGKLSIKRLVDEIISRCQQRIASSTADSDGEYHQEAAAAAIGGNVLQPRDMSAAAEVASHSLKNTNNVTASVAAGPKGSTRRGSKHWHEQQASHAARLQNALMKAAAAAVVVTGAASTGPQTSSGRSNSSGGGRKRNVTGSGIVVKTEAVLAAAGTDTTQQQQQQCQPSRQMHPVTNEAAGAKRRRRVSDLVRDAPAADDVQQPVRKLPCRMAAAAAADQTEQEQQLLQQRRQQQCVIKQEEDMHVGVDVGAQRLQLDACQQGPLPQASLQQQQQPPPNAHVSNGIQPACSMQQQRQRQSSEGSLNPELHRLLLETNAHMWLLLAEQQPLLLEQYTAHFPVKGVTEHCVRAVQLLHKVLGLQGQGSASAVAAPAGAMPVEWDWHSLAAKVPDDAFVVSELCMVEPSSTIWQLLLRVCSAAAAANTAADGKLAAGLQCQAGPWDKAPGQEEPGSYATKGILHDCTRIVRAAFSGDIPADGQQQQEQSDVMHLVCSALCLAQVMLQIAAEASVGQGAGSARQMMSVQAGMQALSTAATAVRSDNGKGNAGGLLGSAAIAAVCTLLPSLTDAGVEIGAVAAFWDLLQGNRATALQGSLDCKAYVKAAQQISSLLLGSVHTGTALFQGLNHNTGIDNGAAAAAAVATGLANISSDRNSLAVRLFDLLLSANKFELKTAAGVADAAAAAATAVQLVNQVLQQLLPQGMQCLSKAAGAAVAGLLCSVLHMSHMFVQILLLRTSSNVPTAVIEFVQKRLTVACDVCSQAAAQNVAQQQQAGSSSSSLSGSSLDRVVASAEREAQLCIMYCSNMLEPLLMVEGIAGVASKHEGPC